MKWFNNLRMRWKLLLGFGMILVLTFVLSVVAIVTLKNSDAKYSYLLRFPNERLMRLLETKENFTDMRRLAVSAVAQYEYKDLLNSYMAQYNETYSKSLSTIDAYMDLNKNDNTRDSETLKVYNQKAEALKMAINNYKTQIAEPASALALEDNFPEAVTVLQSGASIITEALKIIDELNENASSYMHETSDNASVEAEHNVYLLIVLSAAIFILSIMIAILISSLLVKHLHRLISIMDNLVKGNLNINKGEVSKDEIGALQQNVYSVIDLIKNILSDLSHLTHAFTDDGDFEYRIESGRYKGAYQELIVEVNAFSDEYVYDIRQLLTFIEQIGVGNFSVEIKKYPGKKASINRRVDTMKTTLKDMYAEMTNLADSAVRGKLDVKANTEKYHGDWAALLNILNQLMKAIEAPIKEASDVLSQVSAGNFDNKLEGDYQGDFLIIKESINNTVTNVASYINEISNVLSSISDSNDLDQAITREYVGKFSNIKNAINNIIGTFNRIISDILTASEQVASGAKQVSESSMSLSQGASEQASSLEEISATITTVNESTTKNAENARNAENLAISSKNNAQKGNQNMNNMLTSMMEINNSSSNIAKIIKVIDEIAFQTNLLALNAAVEAARAGEHGKGFTVVAGEVRNLAGRSQSAAKETTNMIDKSVNNVKEGSQIADITANALNTIMEDVSEVSGIITSIAESSREQAEAISQVTIGISQITEVVQNNSAISEEAASASQQLSSQAEVLKSLVSVFNLKEL